MMSNPFIKLNEQKESSYIIYLDMDGVLTDFEKSAKKIRDDIFDLSEKELWQNIADAGIEFWENIEWTEDGRKLWNYLKNYNVRILTGLPGLSKNDKTRTNSFKGKKKWLEKNLGKEALERAILTTSDQKYKYTDDKSILIDDRQKNIDSWKENGGIGILHKDSNKTIQELKKYLE